MATAAETLVSAQAPPPVLTPEQEKFNKELETFKKALSKQNDEQIKQVIEEFRKRMEPPKPEDIQRLLNQEYVTFVLKLPVGKGKEHEFTIRELPQEIEKKFYAKLKDKLLPLASELEAMKINLDGADTFKRVLSILNAFEPMLDVLAFAAVLALNPYGEDKEITEKWAQKNLSSTRIMHIVNAQMECNRMRDFFSFLSRSRTLAA